MLPRRTARLVDCDAAYLAGLIDGEGTIALTRLHRGQNRQLAVTISSTERRMLEWVLSVTGVGKITSKRTFRLHHAPGFTYMVANRQALALLAQVVQYLRSYKLGRAQLVLAQYLVLTPRNGKYDDATITARAEFERKFADISIRRSAPAVGGAARAGSRSAPFSRRASP